MNFHFITQNTNSKYGTAVPVSLVVPELEEGESLVVLMGDDFIYNSDGSSEVKRLIESTPENGNSMLGVNVPQNEVHRYGVIETNERNEFVRIVEKPHPDQAPSTLINVSKYVLNYDLLKTITNFTSVPMSGEYYITDPINQYVAAGGSVVVMSAQGQYLDGGTQEGWLYANNVVHRTDH